ncbi:GerW family sporulation protein [Thalassovita sp.]|uniref:GerW family sporulation protein n=1 Tax=Thalassovita sp. TaxID=1979401 RepID=UPI002B2747A1|nr:spore germination protein GerW family protein [Thalassovita sp.]
MQDVEKLLKGTVEELDRLLNARNVLGEPIDREGATVIPIVSYGFGFGAAGGEDAKSGGGAGTGAGGGIKPVGAIVFDGEGARVEAIKGTVSNVAEILVDAASKVAGSKLSGQGKASTET